MRTRRGEYRVATANSNRMDESDREREEGLLHLGFDLVVFGSWESFDPGDLAAPNSLAYHRLNVDNPD
jgi:hypothetical protein